MRRPRPDVVRSDSHPARSRFARAYGWGRSFGLALPLLAALGCPAATAPQAEPEPEPEEEPLPPPQLLDPVNQQVEWYAHMSEDQRWRTADVRDDTELFVDGVSYGTLRHPNRHGSMFGATLELRLEGALRAGQHVLQLRHFIDGERHESRTIQLRILEAPPIESISAELEPQSTGQGLHLGLESTEAGGSLSLLRHPAAGGDPLTQWEVALIPGLPAVGSFNPSLAVETQLRSLAAFRPERYEAPPLSARRDEEGWTHLAWTEGGEQGRIWMRSIDPTGTAQGDRILVEAEELELAYVQGRRLGRPRWAGSVLVFELHAPLSASEPRPGDRSLWSRRVEVRENSVELSPLRRVGVSTAPRDLQGVDTLVDLGSAAIGQDELATALEGGVWTRRLEFSSLDGQGSVAKDDFGPSEALELPLGQSLRIDGALGSHTELLVFRDGRARFRLGADNVGLGQRQDLLDLAGPPSARPAATTLLGRPIFLVPMGQDRPAIAVVSNGEVPELYPVEGLACQELALLASRASNQSGEAFVACLAQGELRWGALRLDAPFGLPDPD